MPDDDLLPVCNQGHGLTPDNTYSNGVAQQMCLACKRESHATNLLLREIWPTVQDRDWKVRGSCADPANDHDFMFPPQSSNQRTITKQKRMCAACPVQVECFTAGFFEPHGIWGGYTPTERRNMARGHRPVPEELVLKGQNTNG